MLALPRLRRSHENINSRARPTSARFDSRLWWYTCVCMCFPRSFNPLSLVPLLSTKHMVQHKPRLSGPRSPPDSGARCCCRPGLKCPEREANLSPG
ncbi:unnamed protein product [Boreogadus saida]